MTLSNTRLEPNDWPALDDDELPTFPVDVLPKDVRAFVLAIAEESQTPHDLAAMAALGILAAASMDVEVDTGLWTEESLGLYLLTAMPSGDRKSTVLRAAVAPLRAREREQIEAAAPRVDEERSRRDVLEVRKRKLTKTAGEQTDSDARKTAEAELVEVDERLREIGEPTLPRLLADDLTPESLGGLLARHGQIAVIAAESAFLDNLSGRYSENGANLHLICAAYQGETTSIDRRNRDPEIIDRPLVSVALSIQPHVLDALVAHPIVRAQGLASRFAYSVPSSLLGKRNIDAPRAPAAVHEKWAACVRLVADRIDRTRGFADSASQSVSNVSTPNRRFFQLSLSLSLSATSLLSALRAEHEPRLAEDGDLRPIMDWAARHPGRIVRLAGLIHLAEHDPSEQISVDTMLRALEIGDYLLAHAIAALTGPDPLTAKALRWLKGRASVTTRELQRGPLGSRGTAEDAATLAATLVEYGALRPETADSPSGPGRPASPSFKVHPHICGHADVTDRTNASEIRRIGASEDRERVVA